MNNFMKVDILKLQLQIFLRVFNCTVYTYFPDFVGGLDQVLMMTSSNENIFRVTGHLCREFTGHRWIPRTKASDAELWCFLWSAPEYTVE